MPLFQFTLIKSDVLLSEVDRPSDASAHVVMFGFGTGGSLAFRVPSADDDPAVVGA